MYSKRSYNNKIMSRHNGLVNSQNYITKASYYAYENSLFITEDDITTFLKSALIKRHVNNHVQKSSIMVAVEIKSKESGC